MNDQLTALGLPGAGVERDIPRFILNDNLYGVDLSPEAVEITQLALWIQSADPSQTLATLSHNIIQGNSLVSDPAVHPHAVNWHDRFPEVFNPSGTIPDSGAGFQPAIGPKDRNDNQQAHTPLKPPAPSSGGGGGFDVIIGNPPWERIKLQEREFFSIPAPEIATASNAAKRRKLVAKLESDDPALYERYEEAKAAAQSLLDFCRKGKHDGQKVYPLTGRGDINTYAVFAELASRLVAPDGRVGLLVPSGIASDKTTKDFFASLAEHDRLIRLYDFENKKVFFPEVHASFKFCFLNFRGAGSGGGAGFQPAIGPKDQNKHPSDSAGGPADGRQDARPTHEIEPHPPADFVFFAHAIEDLEDPKRHIKLTGDDIKLLNPNTRTCPIFRTRRDAEITKAIYRRVPILIDHRRKKTGNPWGAKFGILFHQSKDAHYFRTAEELHGEGFKLDGNIWRRDNTTMLPCYEAKMSQPYDHRAANVRFEDNWARQGQPTATSLVDHQNPEFLALPRWWASEDSIDSSINDREDIALFSFRKVTSPTNSRTLLANFMPLYGAIDSLQFIFFRDQSVKKRTCLMANANSFVLDYCLRQKIGNVNVNYFLVEQLPFFTPDRYDEPCPWSTSGGRKSETLEDWISERVLKLTCTAEDMLPLAEACNFTSGSFKEYDGKLHKWNERERAEMMAELDAAYFHLYGLDRGDAAYILSTFKGIHAPTPLLAGRTVADHILDTYDHLAAHTLHSAR